MNVEELLERTFERHAANAPSADGLADRVQSRVQSRRRRGVLTSGGAALAVAALVFAVIQLPSAVPFATNLLLPGWRWESYGGVEVQVPDSWGYSSYPWNPCLHKRLEPSVARPGGALTLAYCPGQVPEAKYRSNYVGFDDIFARGGTERLDHGWVRQTKVVAGVKLTVASNDTAQRLRIFATARPSGRVDVFGCPAEHNLATPAKGPAGPGLDPSATVESVSVCSFSIANGWVGIAPGKLLASSRLEGAGARTVAEAILAAPQGSGPNSPYAGKCTSDDKLMGDDPMLLRVRTSAGDVDVVVSFGVCAARWTFDGKTSRELTKDLLAAIFHEPHRLQSFDKWMAHIVPRAK